MFIGLDRLVSMQRLWHMWTILSQCRLGAPGVVLISRTNKGARGKDAAAGAVRYLGLAP